MGTVFAISINRKPEWDTPLEENDNRKMGGEGNHYQCSSQL